MYDEKTSPYLKKHIVFYISAIFDSKLPFFKQLDSRKVVQSWPMLQTKKLSTPAIHNHHTDEYLAVLDDKVLLYYSSEIEMIMKIIGLIRGTVLRIFLISVHCSQQCMKWLRTGICIKMGMV